jgi:hypothetical protein
LRGLRGINKKEVLQEKRFIMRKKTLLSLLIAGLTLFGAHTAVAGNPYNGPHNIPCTVQAEDFDEGGLGVAYNDDGGISSSSQVNYRPDNQDVEMKFIEGQTDGPYIGSAGDGQNCWYNYTVVAPVAGNYDFTFYYAMPDYSGNRKMSISVDGELVFDDPSAYATTGSYEVFTSQVIPNIPLKEGENVITIGLVRINFDKFDIAKTIDPKTIEELEPALLYGNLFPYPTIGTAPIELYTRGDNKTIGAPLQPTDPAQPTQVQGPTANQPAVSIPKDVNVKVINPGANPLTAYTLLYDIKFLSFSDNWHCLLQCDMENDDGDGDIFVNKSGKVGQSTYTEQALATSTWYRIVVVYLGEHNAQIYIDGKLGATLTGKNISDIQDFFWIFTDDDGEDGDQDVAAFAMWTRSLTEEEVASLGGVVQDAVTETTPYSGTPIEIPGTVEAEEFDNGAAGSAWYAVDNTQGGAANSIRNDVGLPIRNDGEGDYIILQNRSFIVYTVNIAVDGELLYFSPGISGSATGLLCLYIDDTQYAQVSVATDSEWAYPETRISLPGGEHKMKLMFLGEGSLYINDMAFYAWSLSQYAGTPFNGPHSIPCVIEAEDFDNGGDGIAWHDNDAGLAGGNMNEAYGRITDEMGNTIDVELETYNNSGVINVCWIRGGEWLNYTVEAPATGLYDFFFTLGVGSSPNIKLSVNGQDVATFTPEATGGNQAFAITETSTVRNVSLVEGKNVVTFTSVTSGDYNFDKFEIKASETSIKSVGATGGKVYANDGKLWFEGFSPEASVSVYNLVGQKVATVKSVNSNSLTLPCKGLFIVKVSDRGATAGYKVLAK